MVPWELELTSRKSSYRKVGLSVKEDNKTKNKYFSTFFEQNQAHRGLYIDPDSDESHHLSVSDEYVELVSRGLIRLVQGSVKDIQKNKVIAGEQNEAIDTDVIIFCTGFNNSINFLDEKILKAIEYDPKDKLVPFVLYHIIHRPELEGLAFVGIYRPLYFLTVEMMALFAISLFAGKIKIKQEEVKEFLENERKIRALELKPQYSHGNYAYFTDTIAKDLGMLPDLEYYKVNDFEMYEMLYEGPVLGAHYYLNHQNSEVRERAYKYTQKVNKDLKYLN